MRDSRRFWQGKCVVITGASSGIGRALAEHLAGRGARLGLLARRHAALSELAEALGRERAAVAAADVRDAGQTRAALVRLQRELAAPDVLIANAGIHRYTPGSDFDVASANAVISTNVQGVINAVGAVLPGMLARRRGHLVAVASIAALLGLPQVGAYSASKAAVVALMQSLRVDLVRRGIRVTTVCPGFVDTPMIRDHRRGWPRLVLPAGEAARRIARAVERGRCEYWFPWQMWLLARLGRMLPQPIYCRAAAHLAPDGRATPE